MTPEQNNATIVILVSTKRLISDTQNWMATDVDCSSRIAIKPLKMVRGTQAAESTMTRAVRSGLGMD